jgi:hypothetical protein
MSILIHIYRKNIIYYSFAKQGGVERFFQSNIAFALKGPPNLKFWERDKLYATIGNYTGLEVEMRGSDFCKMFKMYPFL